MGHEADQPAAPWAIIAGFGVPGRAVADVLLARPIPFLVIEQNTVAVERCLRNGVPILAGDVRDEQLLRQAGLEGAGLLVLTIPDDAICLAAIDAARRVNPGIRIIARCTFTSTGLQAAAKGAEAIVAEQVIAREMADVVSRGIDTK